jgi:hypothetical protein
MTERTIILKQDRGFVRVTVERPIAGGFGLPSTYSSEGFAQSAVDRLRRERGWSIKSGFLAKFAGYET